MENNSDSLKKTHSWDYIVLIILVLFFVPIFVDREMVPAPLSRAVIDSTSISVEIARTAAEQQKGLSGRQVLPEGNGMLFMFNRPGRYSFWMPDMHFAIDIVWIGSDWRIADIAPQVTPESYPNVFVSDVDAQYVLEVPAGSVERYGWKVGDRVEFR